MKRTKITLAVLLVIAQQFAIAQTGQWKLAGNNLAGTEKLGSTNNAALNFITNNKTRMSLTGAGNLNISSDQSSIQFALPGANPKPMMFMFPSGTSNTNRMVIAHSAAFPNFGLQYNDFNDRFDFLSDGTSIFNVDLGSKSVGVSGAFNVSGSSAFTGNVNITGGNVGVGTTTPQANLHVVRGSAGVAPFFNAPLVVENSSNSYMNLLAPNNFETGILFGNPGSNVDGGVIYNNPSTFRGFQFRTNGNTTRMVLLSNGFLGVRTVSPAAEMHLLHEDGENSKHGLRLQNSGLNNINWTLYATNSDGTLDLFTGSDLSGFFDGPSGEYTSVSDARRKKDVENASDVLEKVMHLDVKKYHFLKNKSVDKKHYGMIAQEVEKIFPEVVYHKKLDGSQNDLYTMNYSAFGVIAIKAIQEQQKKIDEQEQTNHAQQSIIEKQQTIIEKLQSDVDDLKRRIGVPAATTNQSSNISKETSGLSGAHLNQNAPNPFNSATVINYYLPETKGNASIEVISSNGQLVKTYPVTQKGNGQLTIKAAELSAGTYYYTLKVSGVKVDSKQMILVK